MTRRTRIVGWAGLVLLLLFGLPSAQAQDADTSRARLVDILHADSLTGQMLNGERVRQLYGDVRLRQDSTLLRAQRVVQYLERDDILFFGDVLVIDQGDSLRADTVRYDRRTKVGRAFGRVRLSDGEVLAMAPLGRYDVDAKRADFERGVTLIDSANTLVSRMGAYWTEAKRAEFAGQVRLYGDETYLEADSLTYLREDSVTTARGDVFVERVEVDSLRADTTARTLLFGDVVYSDDRVRRRRVTGRALLLQLERDSTGAPSDTFIVRSDRMRTEERDSLRRLIALDSVAIWQQDLSARADSVVYDRVETNDTLRFQETRLFQDPSAWSDDAQITGDTIRVWGAGDGVDSLFVVGAAFVARQDSATGRIQQLKGRRLVGTFPSDSVRVFTIAPNAEAIYWLTDDEDRPDGGVRASGDRLVIRLDGDAPRRISVMGQPQGTYYSEDQLPQPFRLDGFIWTPDRRPTKEMFLQEDRIRRRLRANGRSLPPVVTTAPVIVRPPSERDDS
ncbi:MAG: organic solvent tolerance protein OstA [Bacteroidetes bacterium]|jgi:lipopolysaccharide export system protein LptA|nr:organic solvent tolerance protein OstA [Bacteroidota bacterium]